MDREIVELPKLVETEEIEYIVENYTHYLYRKAGAMSNQIGEDAYAHWRQELTANVRNYR